MSNYIYPDVGDRLTAELINGKYDPVYWGQSEQALLTRAKEYIRVHFQKSTKELRHLDLGCGEGRLIPEFASSEKSVTGLDPDINRLQKAKKLVESRGLGNVTLFHGDSTSFLKEYPNRQFDTVLCSHIFQHMTHAKMCSVLRDIRQLTNHDAIILITTTFTNGDQNIYTQEYFDNHHNRKSDIISAEDFEKIVDKNSTGTLPVCMFSHHWMEETLNGQGFELLEYGAYHFDDEKDAASDLRNNNCPKRLEHARDAYYIVRSYMDNLPKLTGKVSFCHFYSVESVDDFRKKALNDLTEKDQVLSDIIRIRGDFDTCEKFHIDDLEKRRFITDRYYLKIHNGEGEIQLKGKGEEILKFFGGCAIISVFTEESLVQVSFCLEFKDAHPNDLILLRHVHDNPEKEESIGELCFYDRFKADTILDWCKKSLEECGFKEIEEVSSGVIFELNKIGDYHNVEKLDDFEEIEKKMLYGILTGDEGFNNVPIELVENRLKNSWSSRDFLKVIVFDTNVLSINFNDKACHDTYRKYFEWQQKYFNCNEDSLPQYFKMNSSIAGINHGVFLSLETGLIIRSAMERNASRIKKPRSNQKNNNSNRIEDLKHLRMEIVNTMNRLYEINISEIGELDTLFAKSLNLFRRKNELQEILDMVDSELEFDYSNQVDIRTGFLTLAGVIIALLQLIIALKQ